MGDNSLVRVAIGCLPNTKQMVLEESTEGWLYLRFYDFGKPLPLIKTVLFGQWGNFLCFDVLRDSELMGIEAACDRTTEGWPALPQAIPHCTCDSAEVLFDTSESASIGLNRLTQGGSLHCRFTTVRERMKRLEVRDIGELIVSEDNVVVEMKIVIRAFKTAERLAQRRKLSNPRG